MEVKNQELRTQLNERANIDENQLKQLKDGYER